MLLSNTVKMLYIKIWTIACRNTVFNVITNLDFILVRYFFIVVKSNVSVDQYKLYRTFKFSKLYTNNFFMNKNALYDNFISLKPIMSCLLGYTSYYSYSINMITLHVYCKFCWACDLWQKAQHRNSDLAALTLAKFFKALYLRSWKTWSGWFILCI